MACKTLVAEATNNSHRRCRIYGSVIYFTNGSGLSRYNAKVDAAPSESDSTADETARGIDPELWVDSYGDALFRYAISKLSDVALSEEIVQETFLAGLRSRHKFRGESTVSTWLFSILRRKIADHYRAQSPESTTLDIRSDAQRDGKVGKRSSTDWNADPAVIFEDQEFWRTFDSCVEKLPDKLAEVHILREINGHAPKEICKILGITATNLSMRLHRSRIALRDCLKLHWFQSDD